MVFLIVLLSLFGPLVRAQNPFTEFVKAEVRPQGRFYYQTPPYKYPFRISAEIPDRELDLRKLQDFYSHEILNEIRDLYRDMPFVEKYSLYAFPFAVHPRWEFLPYPFVKEVPISDPGKWVRHFNESLSPGRGMQSQEFHNELDRLTGTRAYAGNKLTLLKTPASYPEILKRLSGVKHHAFISSYLFNCDSGTKPLVELIGRKVREGARIFVMFDSFGSKSDPSCPKKLTSLGARVILFNGGIGKIFHEKMYVFDGEYAIIDGQNLIAAGTLSNGVNNLFNDVAVGASGPVVTKVGQRFIELAETQKVVIPAVIKSFYQESKIKHASSAGALKNALQKGEGLCRLVSKNPGKDQDQILQLYLHTVKNTENYLFFNYIDPKYRSKVSVGEMFLNEVLNSVNNRPHLRVDMLTNNWKDPFKLKLPKGVGVNQNFLTSLVLGILDLSTKDVHKLMSQMKKNLEGKVHSSQFNWWSYAQYMHAKTLMSDNIWTIIGSYNINANSEYNSYEMVLACLDTGLAKSMQESIIIDALNSIPIPSR